MKRYALLTLLFATCAMAQENLALGREVRFAPTPNYGLTKKGDTDATDLTDGKHCAREDQQLWFASECVGFSYGGLQNLAVDLGSVQPIGEVSIRLQGGSPQGVVCFPGWIDVLVSDDGFAWRKVASYTKWRAGDSKKYGLPRDEGKAWVHEIRFQDLKAAGKFVGLSFYTTGLSVTDELRVHKGTHAVAKAVKGEPMAFSVDLPQIHAHKPELWITTNLATPTPFGLNVGKDHTGAVQASFELPTGITFLAGALGGVKVEEMEQTKLAASTRYSFQIAKPASKKSWGRVYFGSDQPGRRGTIAFQTQGPAGVLRTEIPFRTLAVPATPQPKRLLTGMGWWHPKATMTWPDGLAATRALGFNSVPTFGQWTRDTDTEILAFLAEARKQGFLILDIDSPLHAMMSKNRGKTELFCQFEDGTTGKKLCPSYRGPLYQKEIQRVGLAAGRTGASVVACDIELWGWAGPKDCPKCTRCQADFKQVGAKEWPEWLLDKGAQVWIDLAQAVQKEAAKEGRTVDLGGYDFQPNKNYQNLWPIDRLYPKYMTNTQVSTYTPLEPYHLGLIGDEVREDRKHLAKSDQLPWISPGDAGTFPGSMFRYALLETLANGARGNLFWSSRVWDGETLAAYAHAIRNVTPVEDIIMDGKLVEGGTITQGARLSGVRKGDRMFLLVADYFQDVKGPLQLRLPVTKPSRVIDLDSGKEIGRIAPGGSLEISLGEELARPLLVEPAP